ncbi:hypothetical protein [Microcystis aeruginosa]|nr:hypothetical protein [Microcystis aeruginosa]
MLQPNLGSSRHFREWVGNGQWSRVGDGRVESDRGLMTTRLKVA